MGSTKKSDRKRHKRKDEDEADGRKRREDDDEEDRESSKRHKSRRKERKEKKHSKRDYSSDDEPEKKRSKREEASSESEGEEGRSERKRKHRHRRRDNGSPSPHRQKERDGSLTREDRRDADTDQKDSKLEDPPAESSPPPPPSTSGSVVEMSVEETNKLRAQLGLKPLDVGGGGKKEEGEGEEGTAKKEDVHVPAKNLGTEKSAKKMKERMQTLKEKKQVSRKLRSVKALGEVISDGEESALSWVDKMRLKEEEKRMAQERARLLEEMDEEFGVDSLLKATVKDEQQKAYTAQDLSGLSVQHKGETFEEGRTVILTLKDTGVLDNGEDVLENVNIVEEEKATRNVSLKKKKPGYDAYEDEFDEFGDLKEKKVLSKYDEEIEGIKKESFQLGDSGVFDGSDERERRLVQERLQSGAVSLHMAPSQVAKEYYTEEEMVKFKKPKKKRKVKKALLKADDLLPTSDLVGEDVEQGSRDHGRRSRHRHSDEEEDELGMEVDVKPLIVDDVEADNAVEIALARTRKLLNAKREGPEGGGAAKVAQILQQVPHIKQETPFSEDAIVLDRTAEFCLQLGEDAEQRSSKDTARRATLTEEDMDVDVSQEVGEAGEKPPSGWQEVSMDAKPTPTEKDLYQEAEPVVATGMVAALQVASRRGFIETKDDREEKIVRKGTSSAGVKEEQARGREQRDVDRIRDRDRDRDRDRERDQERDRNPHSFPEKKGYRPDVNIVYTDNFGRELESKEAFRFMSHKFHGKGSGKKKTEKRMKRVIDEFSSGTDSLHGGALAFPVYVTGALKDKDLMKADSQDTPLGTLGLMQNKQKQTSLPYVVLTGQQSAPPGASTLSKTKQ